MTTPVWVLLAFAGWTLATLLFSVGMYRWSRILTGRVEIKAFRGDHVEGTDFYRRAMRAHMNCVENLPVYGAIVVAMIASGARSATLDRLSITLLTARVAQTLVHLSVPQTNLVASVRFAFFAIQLVCMVWMGVVVASW